MLAAPRAYLPYHYAGLGKFFLHFLPRAFSFRNNTFRAPFDHTATDTMDYVRGTFYV